MAHQPIARRAKAAGPPSQAADTVALRSHLYSSYVDPDLHFLAELLPWFWFFGLRDWRLTYSF
jgi:hypothetical protein